MKNKIRKILVVFGTRPEAIKLCPLVKELEKYSDMFSTVVCVTAQHRQMLDQVLKVFNVTPDYDLDLMKDNQSLDSLTSESLIGVKKIIDQEKPDLVIVQGDTTTTFSAALASFYAKVRVGHVEAGLRTFQKLSPYPEEINRKLTSVLTDYHYAPTENNKRNLIEEGVAEESITVTGNTVIDALYWVREKIFKENKKFEELKNIDFKRKVILVTGHRRENFGAGMKNVCQALKIIATTNSDIDIVYPVHLNPNVREPVNEILSSIPNVKLIDPLDYEPFVYLMDKAYLIISDSGGIQEEAPSLQKPVLVTRDTTERPEAVETGVVKLVGTNVDRIVNEVNMLLESKEKYREISELKNPYGDGSACKRIVKSIISA